MFRDEAEIVVLGGRGGDGCASTRREKFVPRGGPNGGDGGRGGHVILRADDRVSSLFHLVRKRTYRADPGRPGEGSEKTGRSAEDLIVPVPVGTVIKDGVTGAQLRDLDTLGSEICVCRGGSGGRGNASLATATNRCPRHAHPGGEGERRSLRLELKLIADVGIVGLPNAGKSTLLSRLSAARPKVGSYPFTTLVPQLGIVDLGDYRTLVIADLPGLIEGASLGAGLGDRFLRHVERTRVLLHLVDVSPDAAVAPAVAYHTLRKELAAFAAGLPDKPELVVANKIDLPGWEAGYEALLEACGQPEVPRISTVTGHNIRSTIGLLDEMVRRQVHVPSPGEGTR
jgi:GTP-binding protein